jgi:hypothetical protein
MDLSIRVNRLLAEFANRSGLPALSLDEEGVASLLFDDQLGVTLSFNRHWYRFDLHFGFDEESGLVQLYAQIPAAELTLESFETTLANLLDHAEFWQQLLPEHDSAAEAASRPAGMRV